MQCLIIRVAYSWKEVKHDNIVTWLPFWNDPVNKKDLNYVFLVTSSSLKGQSAREKYEKSRKLKVGRFSLYIWQF
jgi:DNA topoisomerase I